MFIKLNAGEMSEREIVDTLEKLDHPQGRVTVELHLSGALLARMVRALEEKNQRTMLEQAKKLEMG